MEPIYLDYLATTPVCDEASLAMIRLLSNQHETSGAWGNPGSTHHGYGREAKMQLDAYRAVIAEAIGAQSPHEICLESGSTESINHCIRGIFPASARGEGRNHIVTSALEHPAVIETVLALQREPNGISCTIVEANAQGIIPPQAVAAACQRNKTRLVTIMLVNNEVGSVMNWREISALIKQVDEGIILHCDASQAVGKMRVNVLELGVDLLTLAGHKLYAPKGIGATWIRPSIQLRSLSTGAGHESGRRAGTENVLLACGLARAMQVMDSSSASTIARLIALREALYEGICNGLAAADGVMVRVVRNGPEREEHRIPHALSLSFEFLSPQQGTTGQGRRQLFGSEIAKLAWDEHQIAFSAGAACHSGAQVPVPSRVLKAMRLDDALALSTIRLSVGRYTTLDQVQRASRAISSIVQQVLVRA